MTRVLSTVSFSGCPFLDLDDAVADADAAHRIGVVWGWMLNCWCKPVCHRSTNGLWTRTQHPHWIVQPYTTERKWAVIQATERRQMPVKACLTDVLYRKSAAYGRPKTMRSSEVWIHKFQTIGSRRNRMSWFTVTCCPVLRSSRPSRVTWRLLVVDGSINVRQQLQ